MDILVAEDDCITGKMLKEALEHIGHLVYLVPNGQKAWELLQQRSLCMVITDWMMPEMDGLTLCRKIREADFPRYIYLIILTAKSKSKDAITGLMAGADDFLVKPFEYDQLHARVRNGQRIIDLEEKHHKTLHQLVQSEKMASIGQLAAGVAHEINNPTGFVSSNLKTLLDYQNSMASLIKKYRNIIAHIQDVPSDISNSIEKIAKLESEIDLDYILKDTPELISECLEGTERIKKIVINLKDFAHPGEDTKKEADINRCIDSTLNVVWNEIKYKATVSKIYGDIPHIYCYPQQLNQVFMNLLVNAAQSIEKEGKIEIETGVDVDHLWVKIKDTGSGIHKDHIPKIFDPFFTTKAVGQGTGLGLNVVYNIIQKHNGSIDVKSTKGIGTTFTIKLPI